MEGWQSPAKARSQAEEKSSSTTAGAEKEGRQHLDAMRNLEENRGPTGSCSLAEGKEMKKKKQFHKGTSVPSIVTDADWISATDEVEKAIDSPSGTWFYHKE